MKNKKVIIIGVVAVVVLILCFVLFGGGDKGDDWDEVLLSDYLPEIEEGSLNIGTNSETELYVHVEDPGTKYYKEYKDQCIKIGYTVDPKEDDDYIAYNKDGYKLELSHSSSGDIYINLYAPEKMSEFTWPSNGAGAKLPKTSSNYGKINSNSSDSFDVLVGKTSKEDYDSYVTECENAGFNIDFNKEDDYFYAKSSDGYSVTLDYEGNNIMSVKISVVSENDYDFDDEDDDEDESTNSGELRSDFKNAMDGYEKFMDEYVAFMKKYNSSNGSDLSLLQDYSNFLTRYNEALEKFEKWDSEDLNDAETKYYLEVQTRVNKKLLEIA